MKELKYRLLFTFIPVFILQPAFAESQEIENVFSQQDLKDARYEPCEKMGNDLTIQVAVMKDGRAGLIGKSGEELVWARQIPLSKKLNPGKSRVSCTNASLKITSQEPFSAQTTEQTFRLEKPEIKLADSRQYDESEQLLEEVFGLAYKGQLDKILKFDPHKIQYPFQYITAKLLTERLAEAKRIAEKTETYQPAQSALILQSTFILTSRLGGLVTGTTTQPESYSSWLKTYSHMGLERDFYTDLLSRYAQLQLKSYQFEDTIQISNAILEIAPDHTETRILLSDALWQSGNTNEAIEQYRLTYESSDKEARNDLPPRVKKRMTSAGEN